VIAAYVTYRLLFIGNEGHQPYSQVASMGMKFDGGMMGKDGRMFGYIHCKDGDEGRVDEVISALAAWSCRRLTEEESKKWFDDVVPEGTIINGPPVDGGKTGVQHVMSAAAVLPDGSISKISVEAEDVITK